jgi:hypothetical protein
MLLYNATAAFAAGKSAQFLCNSASDYGPALDAQSSSIVFNGPLTMAGNSAGTAGGAMFLERSNVVCNAAANMTNNKQKGCADVS